jgi:multicomponent K+:H+ antiporter subunit D
VNHLTIAPILIPLTAAVLGVLAGRAPIGLQRAISLAATVLGGAAAVLLVDAVQSGAILTYQLGNWPAPWGIVLVADRTAVLLVGLTQALALPALLWACGGTDRAGRYFHALFQFLIAGVSGAFLTGDIFNLFVFFEILLAASYMLLLHGGQPERVRQALHFVLLNLVGSALFLIGVGMLYGVTGTLNMAHLAERVAELRGAEAQLARAAGYVLLIVFSLKAAILPLGFWLPRVYGAAATPVAALFAILTKVGVYAILRVFALIFGTQAGALAGLAWAPLLVAGMATILIAAWAVLASRRLPEAIGWLIIGSVGAMLATIGIATPRAVGAALYYLVHSTLAASLMYLAAAFLVKARGSDAIAAAPRPARWALTGGVFGLAAMAMAGLPPFGGFLGKLLMLAASAGSPVGWTLWAALLAGGLVTVVAVSRIFSAVVWRAERPATAAAPQPLCPWRMAALGWLVALVVVTAAAAGPLHSYTTAAADQLLQPRTMIRAVLGR